MKTEVTTQQKAVDTPTTTREQFRASSPAIPEGSSPTNVPPPSEATPVTNSRVTGTPTVLMSPAPPNVQISYPMMSFDPSQLMILQQVDSQGKITTSPAVSAMDAIKLGLFPATPVMTMSPMPHPAASALVAPPGTPVATFNSSDPGSVPDWCQHYLQIANLQNLTTGFLSPAGQPLSPNPMLNGAWNTLAPSTTTPGLVASPISLRPSPSPLEISTPTHEASERASDNPTGLSSTTHVDDKPGHLPTPVATNANSHWLNVASGYGFPAGPFGVPAHIMPPTSLLIKGQSDAATAGTASSAKLVEDHSSLFAGTSHTQQEFAAGTSGTIGTPSGLNAKPDGRLVDTVLHAKSLTEQMLREFSVEGAANVLRTALSLLGRPPTGGGAEDTDNQTTAGDLGEIPSSAGGGGSGSLPSVKLVHPDEFKNASTFLKIYGDPLCFTKNGPLPKKGRNGNWECSKCNNVNFPRRFRCNMCSTTRDEEGDRVVSEYARQVYERYLYIYRNQQGQNGVHQIILDRDPLVDQPPPPSAGAGPPMNNTPPQLSSSVASAGPPGRQGSYHYSQGFNTARPATRNPGGGHSRASNRYSRNNAYEGAGSAGTTAGAVYGGNPQFSVYPNAAVSQQSGVANQYQSGRQDYSVYY
eukprot:Gregarina_sp_Poly_1__3430@NODE_199_length_11565_cov_209_900244_g178_i0_p2_GENE_NODE_199_length_11565_cov_209_900244_g178_i0NODE_199_length_11565_cov_209_900244_g178_i0_p2_ORF_typecomplete_len640_score60_07zfRanBP/PF00641_18/1_7e08_NODE_199_length_11565_cov_209_900244_g178_i037615680